MTMLTFNVISGAGPSLHYEFQIIDDIKEEISISYMDGDWTNYTRFRDIVDADYLW